MDLCLVCLYYDLIHFFYNFFAVLRALTSSACSRYVLFGGNFTKMIYCCFTISSTVVPRRLELPPISATTDVLLHLLLPGRLTMHAREDRFSRFCRILTVIFIWWRNERDRHAPRASGIRTISTKLHVCILLQSSRIVSRPDLCYMLLRILTSCLYL